MIGELTNHLLQSTLFAVAAWLLTIAFRNNRAQIRCWLWLTASFKFLIPFSLLISLGSHLGWAPAENNIATHAVTRAVSFTLMQMTEPFPDASRSVPPAQSPMNWALIACFVVWACGLAAIALIRIQDWLRILAAVRSSIPLDLPATTELPPTIAARVSPGLLEPGVVGWLRPILLFPAGIMERLTPCQLEAVVAHEMCHVRRRDNLFASIHMIVEAAFWFHPLVWWIGARLVEERERACDEEVLLLGSEPQVYAEGILKVCRLYVESRLVCVSGVTGSDLKKRLQSILTGRVAGDLNFAKKAALAAAGMAALVVPVAVGMMNAPSIRAQSAAAATPGFEVASIRPCTATGHKNAGGNLSPGTLNLPCQTAKRLIDWAYSSFANGHFHPWPSVTISGGPAWIDSDLYEIHAKAAGPESRGMVNGPMLQALLEDRFQLRIHRESREVPVYALTVARGGPKMQPSKEGSCIPLDFEHPPPPLAPGQPFPQWCGFRGTNNGFDGRRQTIADLCTFLSTSVPLDRQVIDKTGITGTFDIHLALSRADLVAGPRGDGPASLSDPAMPATPPDPSSIFAVVQTAVQKLGLKLERAKGPGEFLVIDRVEKPSGN